MRFGATLAVCLGLTGLASAQFRGDGTFPQFRHMSGLSGSMFGVDRAGFPSMRGHMAISTPIGYTLSNGRFVVGVGAISEDGFEFGFEGFGLQDGGGTGQVIAGFPVGDGGAIAGTWMVLSEIGDNVFNVQFSPPGLQSSDVGLAVGIQDILGDGGRAGENFPGDGGSSTSVFAVGTLELGEGVYGSLGAGSGRFEPIFGNLSAPLGDHARAMLEYDAFVWSYGVAFDVASLWRKEDTRLFGPENPRELGVVLSAGLTSGEFGFVALNLTF